eukprot:gene25504-31820_t
MGGKSSNPLMHRRFLVNVHYTPAPFGEITLWCSADTMVFIESTIF